MATLPISSHMRRQTACGLSAHFFPAGLVSNQGSGPILQFLRPEHKPVSSNADFFTDADGFALILPSVYPRRKGV